jgi:hypothetical protein
LFVTIHHDRGSRSSTSATTCTSTCVNNLKVSNYSCRNYASRHELQAPAAGVVALISAAADSRAVRPIMPMSER